MTEFKDYEKKYLKVKNKANMFYKSLTPEAKKMQGIYHSIIDGSYDNEE